MGLGARVLVGIAVVSVLAASCGSDPDDAANEGVDDGGVAAETGATGSTGPEADVQVSLNNYRFDPDPVEVASGDLVAVRNANAKTPHTFTVVGQDVDLELGPFETETVKITLDPGTYELICRFHEALDMTGTLVVT